MRRRFGYLLYYIPKFARMVAKAYIWQELGVKLRNNFPEVQSVLDTGKVVEVRFSSTTKTMYEDEIFFKKLENAGVERNKRPSLYTTFIFKKDPSIKVSADGIDYL